MAEDHGSAVLRRLLDRHPAAVVDTHARLGDATAIVHTDQLVAVMRTLRDDPELAFDMLTDLTCVDYLGEEPRFEMVYHLYSVGKNQRLRVKARVSEQACEIDTLCPLWASANWMEREVWDLYGVRFTGHPDLRRILLYEEFQGHPLRKDYPKERRQPLVGPNN
jgi:NADH-quinone oxidoreductase subunit C